MAEKRKCGYELQGEKYVKQEKKGGLETSRLE